MFEQLAKSFSLKNLPESEVEFSGEIPSEALAPYRERALAYLAERLELPGFRPGHVPADLALQKIGEVRVLEEAVELFVREFYPALIAAHKLDAVGRPDIRVTKLAPNNPVDLTIRTCVYPEVRPPDDWKRLHEQIPLEPYTGELPKADPPPPPEEEQKAREYMAKSARRGKLINALLQKTALAVPRVFIESEQEKIMAQMRDDAKRFGLEFGEYLKKINKTEERIRSEFREQAVRRATLQLILNKIAQEEKIEPDDALVEQEMKHALEHLPAGRQASPTTNEQLRIHIETVLRNEKVLQLLEGEKH